MDEKKKDYVKWEYLVQKAAYENKLKGLEKEQRAHIFEEEVEEKKEKLVLHKLIINLIKLVPIPVVVGVIALYYYYITWGGEDLKKMFISSILGICLISSAIPLILKLLESQRNKIEQRFSMMRIEKKKK